MTAIPPMPDKLSDAPEVPLYEVDLNDPSGDGSPYPPYAIFNRAGEAVAWTDDQETALLIAGALSTPNTPEAPQEGLVEASPDIVALLNSHSEWTLNSSTGAWSKGEQRLPTDKEMAAAAEIRRLRAALTPSPVQSSPGSAPTPEGERP